MKQFWRNVWEFVLMILGGIVDLIEAIFIGFLDL